MRSNKSSKTVSMNADEAHRLELLERYRLSCEDVKLFQQRDIYKIINKPNEKLDLNASKKSGDIIFAVTNSHRFFARNINGKLRILYRRTDLTHDYEQNSNKLQKFKNHHDHVYLHLAISFFLYNENVYYDPKISYRFMGEQRRSLWWIGSSVAALQEFIAQNREIAEDDIRKLIFESAILFPVELDGFGLFINAFLNMDMLKEANIACEELAKFLYSSNGKRNLFIGYMNILCQKYLKAKNDFFGGKYKEATFTTTSSSIKVRPDYYRKSEGVQKRFIPGSLVFFGDRADEFLVKKDSPTLIRIWLEKIEETIDMVNENCESVESQSKISDMGSTEDKSDYIVILPRPKGIKTFIDSKTKKENQVHKNYVSKKEKFDIFIYEQNVYKKVIDEGKAKMISINPSISFRGLLILFLKHKDVALPYVELYHKAFCGTAEHKRDAEEPGDVMNTLKNAVNELKREFDYIKGFSIPRAKNSAYKCEGDFQFCLILKRPTNEHYTMLFKKKFKFTESIPEEV